MSRVITGPASVPSTSAGNSAPSPPRSGPPGRPRPRLRFPGCTRPSEWCIAHHITHWADGSRTDLNNLVLLCGHHHRVIHHGGWHVALAADRRPEFVPPPWIDPDQTPAATPDPDTNNTTPRHRRIQVAAIHENVSSRDDDRISRPGCQIMRETPGSRASNAPMPNETTTASDAAAGNLTRRPRDVPGREPTATPGADEARRPPGSPHQLRRLTDTSQPQRHRTNGPRAERTPSATSSRRRSLDSYPTPTVSAPETAGTCQANMNSQRHARETRSNHPRSAPRPRERTRPPRPAPAR